LGNGDGSFKNYSIFTNGLLDAYQVQYGDVNEDGISDMLTSGFAGGQGWVVVKQGLGNGSFAAASSYSMSGYPEGFALADLNVYGPAAEVKPLPGFFRWSMRGVTTANVYPASY
jgi:hypothetical protein